MDRFLGQRLLAAARLRRYELRVEAAVNAALDRARGRVDGALTAAAVDPFGLDEWDGDVDAEVVDVVAEILAEIARLTVGRLPFSADAAEAVLARIDVTRDVESFVRLVRGIGPEVAAQINAALAQGVGIGESIPELSARVVDVFAMAERRATMIARTETNRAAGRSAYEAGAEANQELAVNRVWLATEDDRTRDTHAEADGQTVAFDEPFDIGGWPAMYPGDESLPVEEVVNCRCALILEAADEGDGGGGAVGEAAPAAAAEDSIAASAKSGGRRQVVDAGVAVER